MTANTATEMSRTRFISRAVVLACAALLSVACQFRDLDYDYIDTAKFTLIFDWSQSSLKGSGIKTSAVTPGAVKPGDVINGRTAAFYPMNGGDPVIKMSHSDTISVNLLVGQYRAVFFNETFEDFDNIKFAGISTFEGLEAVLKEDAASSAKAVNRIAREPDILAVETMIPFEVTEEMVLYTRAMETRSTKALTETMGIQTLRRVEEAMTVTVRPRDVVYPVTVDVVVHGMDDIVSAGAYITGFSGGFDFSAGKPSNSSVTHKVTFTERIYDSGSTSDGIMVGYFNTFGLRPEDGAELSNYTFEFRAALINGEIYTETRNIDKLISEITEDGHLTILIHIGQDVGGGGTDPPIEIPDVEPVGGDDGMWHVDVGDWDEVVVPIDI